MILDQFAVTGIGSSYPREVFWSAYLSADALPDLPLQLTQFNAGRVVAPIADFCNITSPSLTSIDQFTGYGEGSLTLLAHFNLGADSYTATIIGSMPITSWRFDQGSSSATLSVSGQGVVDSVAATRSLDPVYASRIITLPASVILTLPIVYSFLLKGGDLVSFNGGSYRVTNTRLQVATDNSYSEVIIEPV